MVEECHRASGKYELRFKNKTSNINTHCMVVGLDVCSCYSLFKVFRGLSLKLQHSQMNKIMQSLCCSMRMEIPRSQIWNPGLIHFKMFKLSPTQKMYQMTLPAPDSYLCWNNLKQQKQQVESGSCERSISSFAFSKFMDPSDRFDKDTPISLSGFVLFR